MRPYPALDFILLGEPDLTIRDLLDHLEGKTGQRPEEIQRLFENHDPAYAPAVDDAGHPRIEGIKGLVWRRGQEIVVNEARPFLPNLDDLPVPMHELLPLGKYRMPSSAWKNTLIFSSGACPAGCTSSCAQVS